jgi:RNA polymerase sigma-70 factor, ECF subfamily
MTRLARRLAPHADADDIVQDALTRACQKRQSVRRVARYRDDVVTRDRRRPGAGVRPYPRAMAAGQRRPSRAAAPTPIWNAPSRAQELAVHLRYFVGPTVEETARVMDCSAGTVKSTLFNACTRLRTLLGNIDE